jgi:tetratricopeptide (TPR) repeat protein
MNSFGLSTLTLAGLFAAVIGLGKPTEAAALQPKSVSANERDRKQAEATAVGVFQELLRHVRQLPGYDPDPFFTKFWAPQLLVREEVSLGNGKTTRYNAVARLLGGKNEQGVYQRTTLFGRFIPVVEITYSYLQEILQGDPNGIALVLGHELGHHVLGHTIREAELKTGVAASADAHRREADADLYGARLMLKADYSVRKGVNVEWVGLEARNWVISPITGACRSHPGDSDRNARVLALLNDKQGDLWKCMVAFENGATLLAVESYEAAEVFFERVVQEFPACGEAWANLGLARLLHYCDGLSAKDIQDLGIGHFLGSVYYPTARSLVPRGGNFELWQQAVLALKKANELKPDSPITLANLGLACLLHARGKSKMLDEADEYFARALRVVDAAGRFPLQIRINLLVNLGVVAVARGETKKGQEYLTRAGTYVSNWLDDIAAQKAEAEKKLRTYEDENEGWLQTASSVVSFNRGLLQAEGDPRGAIPAFVKFLAGTRPTDLWWAAAYKQYQGLCKAAGVEAQPKEKLTGKPRARKIVSLILGNGELVHVGQSVADVVNRLGRPERDTGIPNSALRRLEYPALGIYLVANKDEVFLLVVTSAAGPAVAVREAGPGGQELGRLSVGMTRKDVLALRVGQTVVKRPVLGFFKDKESGKTLPFMYDFYPDLGVSPIYSSDLDDAVVTGLIVGQLTEVKWD